MLAITRRVGESIAIGDRIVVKVLDIQGQKVQLGIQAPKDVKIGRPEAGVADAGPPVRK